MSRLAFNSIFCLAYRVAGIAVLPPQLPSPFQSLMYTREVPCPGPFMC